MVIIAAALTPLLSAQTPPPPTPGPIAIVPFDRANPNSAAKVTGTMELSEGKALITTSGEVTSGAHTTDVTLPLRGTLRVCASTTVKLAADSTIPAGETPGLLIGLDHGAVEASFATGRNADVVLTPNFRILIGGEGSVEVKVRLAENGDTCVDNPGVDAPYVVVSSVFEDGAYRVQPGQRVMFQQGSLHQVVDNEKEPCGCPPAKPQGNEFPLAQSEGLVPLAPAPPTTAQPVPPTTEAQSAPPLVHNSAEPPQPAPETPPAAQPQSQPSASESTPPAATAQPAAPTIHQNKGGFFHRLGGFFRRIFGAD